jgi:hypothetical protein
LARRSKGDRFIINFQGYAFRLAAFSYQLLYIAVSACRVILKYLDSSNTVVLNNDIPRKNKDALYLIKSTGAEVKINQIVFSSLLGLISMQNQETV